MDIIPVTKLLDLSGKVGVVTGGGTGIGFGIASRLAEAGASVMIADISRERAEKAAAELSEHGWTAAAVAVDVANESDVDAMVKAAVDAFGRLDILVNNAGIYPNTPLMDMTPADFDRVIAINLRGVYLCTRKAAERLIEQGEGGRIVNIASIDAVHPSMVGLAAYDASKHGVWGFTKNVALELAEHRIWVNAVAPGGILTTGIMETQQVVPEGTDLQAMLEDFLAKIPMHRMGEPDDIGKVVLFLCSDMASYMTGTQVVVDGGVLLS